MAGGTPLHPDLDEMVAYRPPAWLINSIDRSLQWRRWYFRPAFLHMERIPQDDTRLLFVGNHSLFGYEFPLLWLELHRRYGLYIRALTDKYLFAIPGVNRALSAFGSVEGNRANCRALMDANETVAVYPGGSREALHARGRQHTLDWGNRTGFVRMALAGGYTIVPFACVGVDDQWDYVYDGQEFAASPAGRLLKKTGIVNRDDLFPPILRGLGGTMVPYPNRHFFGFGNPIHLEQDENPGDERLEAVRDQVQWEIEDMIGLLKHHRETTPDKRPVLRWLTKHR